MKTKPNVLILRTEGTNCDEEIFFAYKLAGGNVQYVHVNELRDKSKKLKDFQILVLPGGFSYGDDVASGKILAVELTSFFQQEIEAFTKRTETLTMGVCNGFQTLIRTGLLPFNHPGKMDATLTNNGSGHFECRWIHLKFEHTNTSPFFKGLENTIVSYQVAHGEGKFFSGKPTLAQIEKQHLVAVRYVDNNNNPTMDYPENPNGSLNAIAGITDPSGRIFGLMPHPERFVLREQHPNWRQMSVKKSFGKSLDKPHGLPIFKNAINYVKNA